MDYYDFWCSIFQTADFRGPLHEIQSCSRQTCYGYFIADFLIYFMKCVLFQFSITQWSF